MKFVVFLFLSFFLPLCLFAQSFEMTSPQVTTLHALYVKAGKTFPFTSFPVSDRRIKAAIEALVPVAEEGDAPTLRAMLKDLDDRPATPRVFAQTKLALGYNLRGPNADAVTLQEQLKDYLNSDPLLYGGLGVIYPNNAFMYMDIEARRVFTTDAFQANIPVQQLENGLVGWRTEFHDVRRGVLSLFTDYLDIYIGRDKIQYGPNESSLIADPDLPWIDAIRLEAYFGEVTLSSRVSTLYNGQTIDDVTNPAPYQFSQNIILNTFHRFQYKSDALRFGVSDNCYFVRPMNNFQLGDIFPVFSYHNADFIPNNNSLVLDLTWIPVKGVEISEQFGLDDVNGNMFGVPDNDTPNIDSEILGIYLPDFYSMKAEFGQAHYLWGSFDETDPMARAIYRLQLNGGDRWVSMTSPYGPGTLWLKLSFHGQPAKDIDVGFKSEVVGHKSGANLVSTPYKNSNSLNNSTYDDWWVKASFPVTFNLEWGELKVTPGARVGASLATAFFSINYHVGYLLYQNYEKKQVKE